MASISSDTVSRDSNYAPLIEHHPPRDLVYNTSEQLIGFLKPHDCVPFFVLATVCHVTLCFVLPVCRLIGSATYQF